ncbi:MAG: hypothetical protein QNJ33_04235 [Crocosphaera sp.]|nr:hypothetical protein [Crocosphaera sp.]
MSKFEELCQVYALAKQKTQINHEACQKFVEKFIAAMSDYFQAPIKMQKESFDECGLMHFETVLILYENPNDQENSFSEMIVISWSLENILDNYILTLYPWMNEYKLFENEFNKFEEIYQFVFEVIKETYQSPITWSQKEKNTVRHLGWLD